jgi:hypothetical protein
MRPLFNRHPHPLNWTEEPLISIPLTHPDRCRPCLACLGDQETGPRPPMQ